MPHATGRRDKKPSRVLTVLVAAFISGWAGAQSPTPEGHRIIHQSWTFKEGAPETVEALAQTADGYLWLGTQAGLYRFDGVRFELFRSPFGDPFPSTSVSALFAPSSGGLWVGYRFGGFSFLRNGKLTNFAESPSPTGTVNGFAQDRNGIVWAATNRGVWRFDRSLWQQNPAEWDPQLKLVAQVGFDREGILWVLTDNRRLEVERQLFYLMPDGRKFRNAGNHLLVQGFTGRIEAEIADDPRFLRLRIRDNGKGIDRKVKQGARPGHWGLPGVHERLKLWSEPGAGTEAELTVPARIAYRTAHRRTRLRLFGGNKV